MESVPIKQSSYRKKIPFPMESWRISRITWKNKKKKKKEDFHDDKSGETFFSSYFLNSHSEHIEFVEIKTFQLKMIKYIFYHPILKIIIEFYTYVIQSFFFRYFNI